MPARHLFLAATVVVGSFGILTPVNSFAQDQDKAAPEIENAKYNFQGAINSAGVNLRSGPGDNYYPTTKLDKGAPITVVGIRFDWLKVTPPKDSFSYVAKAYVTRFGDGSKGRVDKPDLRVRAGSDLNAMKTTVQTTLSVGDEVTILGEADEYYKIAPPANVFLYVNKQFVDPIKAVEPVATIKAPAVVTKVDAKSAPTPPDAMGTSVARTETPALIAGASTQPSQTVAAAPSTQPSAPTAEAIFDKLESDFATYSAQPLDQQPLVNAIDAYTKIGSSDLPESLKRIVDIRLATLKARQGAQGELIALKKSQEEAAQRQVALQAEQKELQERVEKDRISMFTAVGTLRTSSLQQGAGTLYRLTDPSTGRTLVYLRTNDEKYSGMLGQFIGVHGDIVTDQQLSVRIISPSDAIVVDQAKVNNGVTAEVIPPSMLPRAVSSAAQ